MPVIDQSIVIARPAGEVLDLLVGTENLPRRDSSIVECAQAEVVKANLARLARLLAPQPA